jgi:hypothetical protein
VNPRNADTTTVRLATYNSWFAVAKGENVILSVCLAT